MLGCLCRRRIVLSFEISLHETFVGIQRVTWQLGLYIPLEGMTNRRKWTCISRGKRRNVEENDRLKQFW